MRRSFCLIPLVAVFLAGGVLGATLGPDLVKYTDIYQKLEEIQSDVNDLDVLLPTLIIEPSPEVTPVPTPKPTIEVTPEPTVEPTIEVTPEPTTACGASVCPSGSPYGK